MIELKNIRMNQGDFNLHVENATLHRGELTAVLGNNGSGKSTFLSMLSGLKPFEGEYTINNRDFNKSDRTSLSRQIGYLPQEASLNMPFDVSYVVLTGRFSHSDGMSYRESDLALTEQTMRTLDVYHLKNRPFNELSGGEKQRVLFARILNMSTEVLLLDEPFSGVDIFHRIRILNLLQKKKESGLILVVIHDISVAVQHFDRLLLFKGGKLCYNMGKDEILPHKLSEIFGVKMSFIEQGEKRFLYTEEV